jgi:hypothetical protein
MRHRRPSRAPDYTNATLVMALVNLLWVFLVLRAAFGMPTVLLAGYALNRLISRLARG